MTWVKARDGTELYVEDLGSGPTMVLIHGWPLSGKMWEYQTNVLPAHGIRTVTYDRRGFGLSDKPWGGYDYDTLADDLASILETLDLTDVTLVGFSMGGGEVARYMSRHAGKRVSKCVLLGSVVPYLRKDKSNPGGVDPSVFEGIKKGLSDDRPGFLTDFSKSFFGVGMVTSPVSNSFLAAYCEDAMRAAGHATLAACNAWSSTDFRPDLASFSVPTLIIHGDADHTVPIDLTAKMAQVGISGSALKIYEGAPHGLYYTHRDQLNEDLLKFIGVTG